MDRQTGVLEGSDETSYSAFGIVLVSLRLSASVYKLLMSKELLCLSKYSTYIYNVIHKIFMQMDISCWVSVPMMVNSFVVCFDSLVQYCVEHVFSSPGSILCG